jgi:hypothetical protein
VSKKTTPRSRIWLGIAIALVLVIAGAIGWAEYGLAPTLKAEIEKKGSEALGQPMTIKSLSIGFLPVSLTAHEVDFNLQDGKSHIHLATLGINVHLDISQALSGSHIPVSSIYIELNKPEIQLDLDALAQSQAKASKAETQTPAANSSGQALAGLPSPLLIGIKIEDGKIEVKKGALDLNLPITLQSEISLQNPNIQISKTQLNLAGCVAEITGQYDLTQQTGTLKLGTEVADLAKLSTPPQFLPAGKWSGPLSIKIQADNLDGKKWTANGTVKTTGIKGDLQLKTEDVQATGPVQIILDMAFDYNEALKVQKLNATGELQELAVVYKNLFQKSAGIPMRFSIQAQGDQNSLHIEQFDFKLSQISATGGGIVAMKGSSNLHFEIARTSLAGLEKIFPTLAKDPVSGNLQLKASLQGSLQNPEQLQIELQPLLLDQVHAKLNWRSEDKKKSLQGPVFVDAKISLKALGKDLRDANLQSHIVLTDLAIDFQDSLKKAAGFPLVIDILALKKQNQIEFHSSRVLLGKSTVQLDGTVQDPQKPSLDLKISTKALQLADVSAMLPLLEKYQLAGQLTAQAGLTGVYDFKKGITDSPLRLKANLGLQMPKFVYKSDKTVKAKPVAATSQGKTPPPPEPLVPDWPILRTADITSTVRIGNLYYDDLPIEGLAWDGTFKQGTLKGNLNIQKIFSGNLKLSEIKTNLALAQPDTSLQIAFTSLNTNDALTWLSKDWKDLLKGSAFGNLKVFLPHPSRTDFIARTRSDGHVEVKDAFLSTMQIDQVVNQAVSKIPGVGGKQVANSKGVSGDMQMDFNFASSVLNLPKFLFLSPDKNEIQAHGKVGVDKSIDMEGTAYLATAPIGGDVRAANSDASGRFVIPLQIRGSLANPQASFAQSTIEQIIKKTALYELKQQGSKALQDKLEDLKKNGLGSLFGK